MQIVKAKYEIQYPKIPNDWQRELNAIESSARTSYKSECSGNSKIRDDFIRSLVEMQHTSCLEFGHMRVMFEVDRALANQLVRHRHCAFMQESTRYCNYENELRVIMPLELDTPGKNLSRDNWIDACKQIELAYSSMIKCGEKLDIARSLLPLCTATRIVVDTNFTEWRHIFRLRAGNPFAHPDMKDIMRKLALEVIEQCPAVFEGLL